MGLKRGYIVDEDTPVAQGEARIRRFRLANGDHVYLPLGVAGALISGHSPAEEFFFVEKGLLGRTGWAGNLHDVRLALGTRELSTQDLGGWRPPPQEEAPRWMPMLEEDDHRMVGLRAPCLADQLRQQGMSKQANALTIPAWLGNREENGWCLEVRSDSLHGHAWCCRTDSPGHIGPHVPVCPLCQGVKVATTWIFRAAGLWN